jgi:hypothetical protein
MIDTPAPISPSERTAIIVAVLGILGRRQDTSDYALACPGMPAIFISGEAARAWAADRGETLH